MISVESANRIRAIADQYQLTGDQRKPLPLALESGYVMLGLVHPRQFIGRLMKYLDLSYDTAKAIAQEVNAQIFRPVRGHLAKLHGIDLHQAVPQEPRSAFTERGDLPLEPVEGEVLPPLASYTPEELGEQFDKLPPDYQDTIMAVERTQVVVRITQKHELDSVVGDILSEEIGLVLLGATPSQQFVPRLVEHAGMSSEAARAIGQEVNEQIFHPLQKQLDDLHAMVRPTHHQSQKPTPTGEVEEEVEVEIFKVKFRRKIKYE